MCPSSKVRRWWAHFTVLGAFKYVHPAREQNDGPTLLCLQPLNVSIQQERKLTGPLLCASLCLETSNDHVIRRPMRRLKKDMEDMIDLLWHQNNTLTTRQNGPVGRFVGNEVAFWWKGQLPDNSLKKFLILNPFRPTIEYLKGIKICISMQKKIS